MNIFDFFEWEKTLNEMGKCTGVIIDTTFEVIEDTNVDPIGSTVVEGVNNAESQYCLLSFFHAVYESAKERIRAWMRLF